MPTYSNFVSLYFYHSEKNEKVFLTIELIEMIELIELIEASQVNFGHSNGKKPFSIISINCTAWVVTALDVGGTF